MLLTVNTKQSPITFNQRVGANIQKFRKAVGMSQAELGRALGHRGFPMEQQTILTIERGSRPLKLEEFAVIAELLRVDPGSLVEKLDERSAALEQLRIAETAIARCDHERQQHRQEIERLDQEIEHYDQRRRETAEQLAARLKAEGRPDLASFYANLLPAEDLITTWKKARDGEH
jgi:transcriptional regulator with XRE-family HTH domain